jgi:hypothetical protein
MAVKSHHGGCLQPIWLVAMPKAIMGHGLAVSMILAAYIGFKYKNQEINVNVEFIIGAPYAHKLAVAGIGCYGCRL